MRVRFDYHTIEDWEKLQLGPFHPESGVDMTAERRTFFSETLKRCKEYRKLMVCNPNIRYPPITVLRSARLPTATEYLRAQPELPFDFTPSKVKEGDGRITVTQATPPPGVPILAISTNHKTHSTILSDLPAVHSLLNAMLLTANPNLSRTKLTIHKTKDSCAIMLPILIVLSVCVLCLLHLFILPPWEPERSVLPLDLGHNRQVDVTNISTATLPRFTNTTNTTISVDSDPSPAECSNEILRDCVSSGPFAQHIQSDDNVS